MLVVKRMTIDGVYSCPSKLLQWCLNWHEGKKNWETFIRQPTVLMISSKGDGTHLCQMTDVLLLDDERWKKKKDVHRTITTRVVPLESCSIKGKKRFACCCCCFRSNYQATTYYMGCRNENMLGCVCVCPLYFGNLIHFAIQWA